MLSVMGQFVKLVDTVEKMEAFKRQYHFQEDVHLQYIPKDDLALLQNVDLVFPMVAII
jgi:hypothetical protein